ncbi:MAG: hypothetical protein LBQ13_04710 [Endomicrobium sp.]|jgi:hypothetical protein|nr:hypothetical protein [Endomicrobium sp.]
MKEVKFKVTKITDSRKSGSTLELGKIYEGFQDNYNRVHWKDFNGDEWVFWVNDTCELILDEKNKMDTTEDLYSDPVKIKSFNLSDEENKLANYCLNNFWAYMEVIGERAIANEFIEFFKVLVSQRNFNPNQLPLDFDSDKKNE